MKTEWKVSDTSKAKYLGLVEIETGIEDWEVFEILETSDKLIFGGSCNIGFLESGYLVKEDWESTDEALQDLVADLETYYRDGSEYVERIVCNERM